MLLVAQSLPSFVAAQQPRDSSILALQFLEASNVDSVLRADVVGMGERMSRSPTLAPYRAVIMPWANRYFVWDSIRAHLVPAITSDLSQDDLKQLVTFYQSPLGQRLLKAHRDMRVQLAAELTHINGAHKAELDSLIKVQMQRYRQGADTAH